MPSTTPVAARRVAARLRALRRQYPRLRLEGEEPKHLATLLVIRDTLVENFLAADGNMPDRKERLLGEIVAAIERVGARCGIFSPMPRAGTASQTARAKTSDDFMRR